MSVVFVPAGPDSLMVRLRAVYSVERIFTCPGREPGVGRAWVGRLTSTAGSARAISAAAPAACGPSLARGSSERRWMGF